MNALSQLWNRLPVAVRAVLASIIILICGTIPWTILVSLNMKIFSSIPWAILPMSLYLWVLWRYLAGKLLSKPNPETRRINLRVKPLSGRVWGWSLLSGALAFVSLGALKKIVEQLLTLPHPRIPDYSQYPLITVLSAVLMGAAVSGIVEEAAFRGYMQVPLEKRYGLTRAIIIVGIVFGLVHFTHPWMTLQLLPMYIIVAAVYGILAKTTGSILPGVVIHFAGNAYQDIFLLLRGTSASQLTTGWETIPDFKFLLNCLIMIFSGVAAILSYQKLRSISPPGGKDSLLNTPAIPA
jgi:membrane protease YdiL (CAAX protease family)